ncbi:MAG: N-6 DNA methylase, partial [Candidatus Sigynarchaeota archaeon]
GFVEGSTATDEIRRVTREHRRNTGMYYTPASIARFIARKAIEQWFQSACHGARSIKILDPACGNGVFLCEAIRAVRERANSDHACATIKPYIHGIDIDEMALRDASASLSRVVKESGVEDYKEMMRLVRHDALDNPVFPDVAASGGFDIIIGNPPYVPWNRIPRAERAVLECGHFLDVKYACRPNHADAQPNYYLFFIALASFLINDSGVISFLLPQEWLYHERAIDFRRYLLDHFKSIDISLFPPDAKIFSQKGASAGTTSMILTLSKHGRRIVSLHALPYHNEGITAEQFLSPQTPEKFNISFDAARDAAWVIVDKNALAIKNAILRQPVIRFDDASEFAVHGGFQPPVASARKFEIDGELFSQLDAAERVHVFPLVHDAREIGRYVIMPVKPRYWIVANSILSERELESNFPNLCTILKQRADTGKPCWWHFPNVRNLTTIINTREKILVPRTASAPRFALDDRRCVFKGTNTMIIPKKMNARYVLAILNSRLAAFWQYTFGFGYHSGVAKKLEPSKARKTLIPVKIPSPEAMSRLVDLVNLMIVHVRDGAASSTITEIQKKIDVAIYDLYEIDGEMQKFIASMTPAW